MFRLNLRAKLLWFSILLALLPIGVAGYSLLRMIEDELKSSVNDELVQTATKLAEEIDLLFNDIWVTPLLMLRDTFDNTHLGPAEKLALLKTLNNVQDLLGLQIYVEGLEEPLLLLQDDFVGKLKGLAVDPLKILKIRAPKISIKNLEKKTYQLVDIRYLEALDTWLLTLVIPLKHRLLDKPAVLLGYLNLNNFRQRLANHPFNKTGMITLVDQEGFKLLDPLRPQLTSLSLVADALSILASGNHPVGVLPYMRPQQTAMLGGYAFPKEVPWVVLVERYKLEAYAPVYKMLKALLVWLAFGLIAAVGGAIIFSKRLSDPVLKIQKVVKEVGKANFNLRVNDVHSHDEIGTLAVHINEMIAGLQERERIKDIFGRYQTVEVMQTLLNTPGGITLGGERKRVTIMMTDLRGYTALSATLEPEQILKMLNNYFERMVDICTKYRGTINEIIGDALLVMFGAPLSVEDHAERALACALEMQRAMEEVNALNQQAGLPALEMGIGINTGEVVVGNIGSEKRTKYGVVGSDVNLASRIESYSVGSQILLSASAYQEIQSRGSHVGVEDILQVAPKGVPQPINIYIVKEITGAYNVAVTIKKVVYKELKEPLPISCFIVEGKDISETGYAGELCQLSADSAWLRLKEPLKVLTNLKIAFLLTSAHGGEGVLKKEDSFIYAKVITAKKASAGGPYSELIEVRFTSVNTAMHAFMAELLQEPVT